MNRVFLAMAILAVAIGGLSYLVPPRTPDPFEQRMAYLIAWIAARTDYSSDVPLPKIRFLSREQINYLHHSQTEAGYHGQRNIIAFYDDARQVITLPSTFDIRRDEDTLVHELVHHLQNVHGRRFRCPEEREREAYQIQARFVAETGIGTMPSPSFIATLRCQ